MIKTLSNIIIYLFFPSIFVLLFTTNYLSNTGIILQTISYIILLMYFIYKYNNYLKKDLKSFKTKYIKTILIYWLIGFILMLLFDYIINNYIIINGISNNELNNLELIKNYTYIYPISVCILIPILEEIVFKLELKNKYKNKYLFIIVSAFIFTIPHLLSNTKLIELIYFIPYFTLGITINLIYSKTDNIYSSILAHMLHNTIIVIYYIIFL